jgi:hypothetical protein
MAVPAAEGRRLSTVQQYNACLEKAKAHYQSLSSAQTITRDALKVTNEKAKAEMRKAEAKEAEKAARLHELDKSWLGPNGKGKAVKITLCVLSGLAWLGTIALAIVSFFNPGDNKKERVAVLIASLVSTVFTGGTAFVWWLKDEREREKDQLSQLTPAEKEKLLKVAEYFDKAIEFNNEEKAEAQKLKLAAEKPSDEQLTLLLKELIKEYKQKIDRNLRGQLPETEKWISYFISLLPQTHYLRAEVSEMFAKAKEQSAPAAPPSSAPLEKKDSKEKGPAKTMEAISFEGGSRIQVHHGDSPELLRRRQFSTRTRPAEGILNLEAELGVRHLRYVGIGNERLNRYGALEQAQDHPLRREDSSSSSTTTEQILKVAGEKKSPPGDHNV